MSPRDKPEDDTLGSMVSRLRGNDVSIVVYALPNLKRHSL
jgi:hypothetical protein